MAITKDKYNAEFIDFALKNLAISHYVSVQYLMCVLIETGLENHPTYSPFLAELRNEFNKWKEEQNSQNL